MKKIKKIIIVYALMLLLAPWSVSALTDPFGYVYTKINTDENQPLVLNAIKRLENVRVVLHRFDEASGNWVKWNAEQYYQENPVFTSKEGQYSFSVPAGQYYLTTTKDGYQFYRSKIMKVSEANPVELNIFLSQDVVNQQQMKNIYRWLSLYTGISELSLTVGVAMLIVVVTILGLLLWAISRIKKR